MLQHQKLAEYWLSVREIGILELANPMLSQEVSYSERYCAFIDILGFRGVISDLDRKKISVAEVHRVLSAVHSPRIPVRQEAELRHQSISDAVALSAAPNAAGFDAICSAAEELSRMLMRKGYFSRGGITKGQLFHDSNMVFGPALVDAYRLESEVARYPRILIPRAVAAESANYAAQGAHWKEAFDGRFIQAEDGPLFLHVLRRYEKKSQATKDDPQLILLKQIRTSVQRRYEEATDNPEHFQKVAWFVRYWNTHIDTSLDGLEPIERQPL